MLIPNESQRFVAISKALLGRLDEVERWQRTCPRLAAAAERMRCAWLVDDDMMIDQAVDELMEMLPPKMSYSRPFPKRAW